MQDRFVWTADGRIHYLESGSGAPLILLHSVGCSAHEYDAVLESLGRRFTVLAWDMPGHGDSSALSREYSIDDFAQAVVNFMDAAGVPRAIVGGSSIGGAICAALGVHDPGRVERLLFIESPLRSESDWAQNWSNVEANFGIPTQTLEQLRSRFRSPDQEFLTRWNIDRNKAGAKSMVDAMWSLRHFDMAAALPRISTRSLVLYGARGPTVGKSEEFMRLLSDAEVVLLDESGHFPMVDEPERFVDAVSSFVLQTSPV